MQARPAFLQPALPPSRSNPQPKNVSQRLFNRLDAINKGIWSDQFRLSNGSPAGGTGSATGVLVGRVAGVDRERPFSVASPTLSEVASIESSFAAACKDLAAYISGCEKVPEDGRRLILSLIDSAILILFHSFSEPQLTAPTSSNPHSSSSSPPSTTIPDHARRREDILALGEVFEAVLGHAKSYDAVFKSDRFGPRGSGGGVDSQASFWFSTNTWNYRLLRAWSMGPTFHPPNHPIPTTSTIPATNGLGALSLCTDTSDMTVSPHHLLTLRALHRQPLKWNLRHTVDTLRPVATRLIENGDPGAVLTKQDRVGMARNFRRVPCAGFSDLLGKLAVVPLVDGDVRVLGALETGGVAPQKLKPVTASDQGMGVPVAKGAPQPVPTASANAKATDAARASAPPAAGSSSASTSAIVKQEAMSPPKPQAMKRKLSETTQQPQIPLKQPKLEHSPTPSAATIASSVSRAASSSVIDAAISSSPAPSAPASTPPPVIAPRSATTEQPILPQAPQPLPLPVTVPPAQPMVQQPQPAAQRERSQGAVQAPPPPPQGPSPPPPPQEEAEVEQPIENEDEDMTEAMLPDMEETSSEVGKTPLAEQPETPKAALSDMAMDVEEEREEGEVVEPGANDGEEAITPGAPVEKQRVEEAAAEEGEVLEDQVQENGPATEGPPASLLASTDLAASPAPMDVDSAPSTFPAVPYLPPQATVPKLVQQTQAVPYLTDLPKHLTPPTPQLNALLTTKWQTVTLPDEQVKMLTKIEQPIRKVNGAEYRLLAHFEGPAIPDEAPRFRTVKLHAQLSTGARYTISSARRQDIPPGRFPTDLQPFFDCPACWPEKWLSVFAHVNRQRYHKLISPLSKTLGRVDGPVDITGWLKEGENEVELMYRDGCEDFAFFVFAITPSAVHMSPQGNARSIST